MGKKEGSGYYEKGNLVTIIEETNYFITSNFTWNYTDFGVECIKRIKINDIVNIDKSTQVVIAKVEVLNDVLDNPPDPNARKALVEELRQNAITYCMLSKYGNAISKQKAKIIQNCTNDINLCYKAAALLTLTRNMDK